MKNQTHEFASQPHNHLVGQKGGASSMAELMQKSKQAFIPLKKGELVTGTISRITPTEMYLDLNGKTEALVLEKEKKNFRQLKSLLKVGDKVQASVLNVESDFGYPVVSLRRFLEDALWKRFEELKKDQQPLSVMVDAPTRGGYLVSTEEALSGFLPQSQLDNKDSQDIVGKKMQAYILELNRTGRKIIFSGKASMGEEEFAQGASALHAGDKVTVTISNVTTFGVFAKVPLKDGKELDGLIHISEISWDKVGNLPDEFHAGETIDVEVIKIDKEAKRIDLSLKRLTKDPFEEAAKHFAVDQKVSGKVKEIVATGVVVTLTDEEGNSVEGIIRKEKIPPTVTYEAGNNVTATISQIDTKRRKLTLVPVLLEKPIGYR